MQAVTEQTKNLVKEKLQQYLESLEDSADIAIDFGKEQVPLLLQEIITYEIFKCLTNMCLYLVAIISLVIGFFIVKNFIIRNGKRLYGDNWISNCHEIFIVYLFSGILLIACSGLFIDRLLEFGKVYFAPRLFILEKLTEMIR